MNNDLRNYLVALSSMFEVVFGIVSDQGEPDTSTYVPGWSTLLDPTTCPTAFLPYLGQFIGVQVPPGTDDITGRAMIRAENGFNRGTGINGAYDSRTVNLGPPAADGTPNDGGAIVQACQNWLNATQSCVLLERIAADGSADAYHFVLVVRPEEVIDVTRLTAAVNNVKPAGIQWTLVQTDMWTISQMEADYTHISDLEAAFITVTGLEQQTPGT